MALFKLSKRQVIKCDCFTIKKGNCETFSKFIGSRGKDVLYVGDHIFGDIIKSKKQSAWRTFLVVPELNQELKVWQEKRELFTQIEQLNDLLSHMLV